MHLLAVHIADGILTWPWIAGGFLVAAILVSLSCYRIADSEIPMAALVTAALFVASSIHLKAGPTSVHLLLNGLAGVLLGWRVGAAIAVALVMQAVLLSHGGFSTLGINICILTLPALVAAFAFRISLVSPLWSNGLPRSALVFTVTALWLAAIVVGVGLVSPQSEPRIQSLWVWIAITLIGILAASFERRMENEPTFAVGLLLGVATTLLTVALNAFVLRAALPRDTAPIAGVVFLAHLPVAAIEGIVMGSALTLLKRSAPQLLPRSLLGRVGPRE